MDAVADSMQRKQKTPPHTKNIGDLKCGECPFGLEKLKYSRRFSASKGDLVGRSNAKVNVFADLNNPNSTNKRRF